MHRLGRERLWPRLRLNTWLEKDHVIPKAKRHELQAPKPHHRAKVEWVETIRHLGFPEGKGIARRRPLPGVPVVDV